MSTTAPKREVRQLSSRWPVTVAAILGGVALLLVAVVALRSDQNDVLSFAGVPSEVVIQSNAGLILVVPSEGSDVQVSRRAEWTIKKPAMRVEMSGGSLVVAADCEWGTWFCDVEHRVAVPAGIRVRVLGGGSDVNVSGIGGEVDIQTGGGDVTVADLNAPVKIRTSGGDISVTNVSADLDLASESGDVTGDSLGGLVLRSATGSGDTSLTITGFAERIGVGSSSGDITLVVPEIGYQVDAQAASGEVTVDVTEVAGSAHTITAATGSGQISITAG